jgi:N-carbamoyl-L-amino-acid hydrolase
VPLDPARVVAGLRELRELTGDAEGAQRVAWTQTWSEARRWLGGLLDGLPLEHEVDEAGNDWWTLRGDSERAVLIGGHIDSVPNGGWLDGALNVVAAAEVVRRIAEDGTPPVTVRLVNWADEEGARFGRSLFGSSAARDDGRPGRAAASGRTRTASGSRTRCASTASTSTAPSTRTGSSSTPPPYLELHIEQGPVLESMDLPLGAVLGTFGVERHRITWTGQAAHAGSTPMDQRRDALAGAAKLALEIRDDRERAGGGAVCTSGGVVCQPGSSPRSSRRPSSCSTSATSTRQARAMLARRKEASSASPPRRTIEVAWERIWNIEPILFDETLIGFADEAIREVAGTRTGCRAGRSTTRPRCRAPASRR